MEIVLTGDNNDTLVGTLVLETHLVHTPAPPPTSTLPPPDYDHKGATMYAVAVILLYSVPIVFMIASHTYMKRKNKRRGGEDDLRTVNKYLKQAAHLRELTKKDSFRRLKTSIIPLLSIAIRPDLLRLNSEGTGRAGVVAGGVEGGEARTDQVRRVRFDLGGVGEVLNDVRTEDDSSSHDVSSDTENLWMESETPTVHTTPEPPGGPFGSFTSPLTPPGTTTHTQHQCYQHPVTTLPPGVNRPNLVVHVPLRSARCEVAPPGGGEWRHLSGLDRREVLVSGVGLGGRTARVEEEEPLLAPLQITTV